VIYEDEYNVFIYSYIKLIFEKHQLYKEIHIVFNFIYAKTADHLIRKGKNPFTRIKY
jgi:hypothetical protein